MGGDHQFNKSNEWPIFVVVGREDSILLICSIVTTSRESIKWCIAVGENLL